MNNRQIRSGHPVEKKSSGKMEEMLQLGYGRLKQALAPMPEAIPAEEQYRRWRELLKRQRTVYLQREAQQFDVNNKAYELALLATPVNIKALNDDLDALLDRKSVV